MPGARQSLRAGQLARPLPKALFVGFMCAPHSRDTLQVSLKNLGKLLWEERGRNCSSRFSCNFSLPFSSSNLSSPGCFPGCVLCMSVVCLRQRSRSDSSRRSHGLMFQERETVSVRVFFGYLLNSIASSQLLESSPLQPRCCMEQRASWGRCQTEGL